MDTQKIITPIDSKISVRDLNFYYGKFHALKGINLEIEKNCVYWAIGLRQIDIAQNL
jgi:phosphate transport system ATP-binding protein